MKTDDLTEYSPNHNESLEWKSKKVEERTIISWKKKKGDLDVWSTFSERIALKMTDWIKKFEGKSGSEVQEMYSDWWKELSEAADECLGRQIDYRKKSKRQVEDAILRVLLQERNAARRRRNKETGANRARAHVEYTKARKAIKVFLKKQQIKKVHGINEELQQLSSKNPSKYWALLKEYVGIDRRNSRIPQEITWTTGRCQEC